MSLLLHIPVPVPYFSIGQQTRELFTDMMTPVLVISGRVHHQGSVPSREQTKTWLSRAYGKADANIDVQIIVEVLGPGCTNCEKVYQNT